jgi:predicted glycosyltransferase
MRILLYFGHPSQYLFFKNALSILKEKGINCDLIIKSKDVLEKLLIENNESFINILPEGRNSGRIGILWGLIKRDYRLFKIVKGKQYDIFIGTDPSLAHIGFIKKIPVITVLEDDIWVIPELARITFPFTSYILTPKGCQTGKYEIKTIHYNGYMKLAYLHPLRFKKVATVFKQPYFLIRTSKLNAYHDSGISGFSVQLIKRIINLLQEKGLVYISSEGKLEESLKQYELNINPSQMLNILANATMMISDSQSMTMEAAMLGIPSIRFSDFAGRISVLEELEHVYGLTYGILTSSPQKLFHKINELLSLPNLSNEFEKRRSKMLEDKIDVTAFLVWFIENFSDSVRIMKENPDYQFRFKNNTMYVFNTQSTQ